MHCGKVIIPCSTNHLNHRLSDRFVNDHLPLQLISQVRTLTMKPKLGIQAQTYKLCRTIAKRVLFFEEYYRSTNIALLVQRTIHAVTVTCGLQ